ncbi:AAA family ATPase [Vibrio fluvialis]|uniref:AAA family ATPase n=1 Tax=Vibrio fluvialis TaxID=676 RepID=UPI001BB03799|nr:AAA family ATPase [Vibrio fluvialis]EKO3970181.1 AAA family ATPase [Vibrio fluvialis]QUF68156.1 AAA family ATPase [Vibrio fluvialis]
MKLTFKKLKKGNIFTNAFLDLKSNNEIDLESKNICVIYGPNGTGKTSLTKILSKEKSSEYIIDINGEVFTEKNEQISHIISDQNDRNLIQGETQDFILGDDIKREYDLKEKLNTSFSKLFEVDLPKLLKTKFGISTKSSQFDQLISKDYLVFISDIANVQSKGKSINRDSFIEHIYNEQEQEAIDFDEDKLSYFIKDYSDKNSTIRTIVNYEFNLKEQDKRIVKLEEQSQAVKILKQYGHREECIVCDTHINPQDLLKKKSDSYESVQRTLSDKEKEIAEKIIQGLPSSDPFKIRETVLSAINDSDRELVNGLVSDFNEYKKVYWNQLKIEFIKLVKSYNLKDDNDEYKQLKQNQPKFDDEDILFIENFLNETLEKKITLSRDKDNNIKLLLGGNEFLHVDRKNLSLSNGEQNFLSLSFELLKAKNSDAKFIVLDDPISSFDSIYKNKLAYAIISFLKSKRAIILTHNTDLIKLLEHQQQESINLYYFNNIQDENNGFITINKNEIKILLYIHELIQLLRNNIKNEIIDKMQFLISIAPFMRGYCQILAYTNEKNELTKLMHGYNSAKVNLTEIYKKLFGEIEPNFFDQDYLVSASDIIAMDSNTFNPIKSDNYPLLAKSLRHTMNYLFLRLNVEKKLVDKFTVNLAKNDLLSKIILASFPFKNDSPEKRAFRVFFMSRKTLLNEFNHFEMDMNIFQPAIDITDKSLNKEKEQIMLKLQEIDALI